MTTNHSVSADIAAGVTVVGTFFDYLPKIAAVLAILWYAVQVWESETVQGAVKWIVTAVGNLTSKRQP